jgi:hypothetical protein
LLHLDEETGEVVVGWQAEFEMPERGDDVQHYDNISSKDIYLKVQIVISSSRVAMRNRCIFSAL